MRETAESIKVYGVLFRVIVHPWEEGEYEILTLYFWMIYITIIQLIYLKIGNKMKVQVKVSLMSNDTIVERKADDYGQ